MISDEFTEIGLGLGSSYFQSVVTAHIFCRLTKTIIDAVLGLNFDDPPSNLAAAALVYLLTIDVSDFDYM